MVPLQLHPQRKSAPSSARRVHHRRRRHQGDRPLHCIEQIVTIPHLDDVVSRHAIRGSNEPADNDDLRLDEGITVQLVLSGTTCDIVITGSSADRVFAIAGGYQIAAITTVNTVIARTGRDSVVSRSAQNLRTIKRIDDRVIAATTEDLRLRPPEPER